MIGITASAGPDTEASSNSARVLSGRLVSGPDCSLYRRFGLQTRMRGWDTAQITTFGNGNAVAKLVQRKLLHLSVRDF